MKNSALAHRYTEALYELALEKNLLEEVQKDLQHLLALIEESSDLQAFLANDLIASEEKKEVCQELFSKEIGEITTNFIFVLIEKRREKYLQDIIEDFLKILDDKNNIIEAELRVAFPIEENEKNSLVEELGTALKKKVRLQVKEDPTILGGSVLKIGDNVIDASVRTRLKNLKNTIEA